MQDLKTSQLQGDSLPTIAANKNGDYKIREVEKHLIHVVMCMPGYDQKTGAKLHKPFVQMFYPNEFENMNKKDLFKGYEVEIIHDPRTAEEIVADLKNDVVEKPLSRMNTKELNEEYARVYGVPVPETLKKNDEIRAAIEERIAFLEEEAKKNNPGKANEEAK